MANKQEQIFSSKTLTYFLQLTETMNYTQAAKILGISQPALTQQMKKLQAAVGAPLFDTFGKKLKITDAGYEMLRATQDINERLTQAADNIQSKSSADKGTIRIGVLASIDTKVITEFASEAFKETPGIKIVLVQLSRKEMREQLTENDIDLVLTYLPDSFFKNWETFSHKTLYTDELLYISRDSDEGQGKDKIWLGDIDRRAWASYPEDSYLGETLSSAFNTAMVNEPEVVTEMEAPEQLAEFSRNTRVHTALPETYVSGHTVGEGVNAVPFQPSIGFEVGLVYRSEKIRTPRISRFLGRFDDYLAEQSYLSRLENK
ncbi:LysR family transcriptional regulator [Secundilactobacillus kimchicus]|uniref:LysR family transcriptional regulator n=1 Tax=Secundilactobacillus kimchicus TaxID=528209 RepID=UPI001C009872|nr:LysR family transcriptional regulator [Secundilactobacillus kimchicus]MBT9670468.1 LysR family transcriptional regulator [Secundilactobacillus kimchicus]